MYIGHLEGVGTHNPILRGTTTTIAMILNHWTKSLGCSSRETNRPRRCPPTWPKRSTLLALNSRSSSSTKRCMALEGDGRKPKNCTENLKTHRKPVGNALFFFRGYRSWMYPYEKSLYKPLYFVGIYGLVIIPKNPIRELLIDTMGTLLGVHPIVPWFWFWNHYKWLYTYVFMGF